MDNDKNNCNCGNTVEGTDWSVLYVHFWYAGLVVCRLMDAKQEKNLFIWDSRIALILRKNRTSRLHNICRLQNYMFSVNTPPKQQTCSSFATFRLFSNITRNYFNAQLNFGSNWLACCSFIQQWHPAFGFPPSLRRRGFPSFTNPCYLSPVSLHHLRKPWATNSSIIREEIHPATLINQ